MVQKDTAGIPKGRMEGVILDCTDHCQLIHVELTDFGQEREMIPAAATALGLIPCVFSLAESLGFARAENSVSDNLPWLLGESLGVLSGIAARQTFFTVTLPCLESSTFIYICTKGYSCSPLTGTLNCTRLKPAP